MNCGKIKYARMAKFHGRLSLSLFIRFVVFNFHDLAPLVPFVSSQHHYLFDYFCNPQDMIIIVFFQFYFNRMILVVSSSMIKYPSDEVIPSEIALIAYTSLQFFVKANHPTSMFFRDRARSDFEFLWASFKACEDSRN